VFSTVDPSSAFHQIQLEPSDTRKTAFLTHKGLFEYLVLPFSLSNSPAILQNAMNVTLGKYINKFVLVYLDDIMVLYTSSDEHMEHIRLVFEALRKDQYYCRLDKCHFLLPEVNYLGHIVGASGLKPDPTKLSVVRDWPTPTNLNELRSFLGLVSYFRRFVQGHAMLVQPMQSLLHKDAAWKWDHEHDTSLAQTKAALLNAPVLALPDPKSMFCVFTDASFHGCGGILIRNHRIVASCGRKLTATEHNYSTTEQEFGALVYALQQWRCYWEGVV
jgi:hypothetical protein